jgi:DNA-binding MarR family transcriptional regulator
VGHLVWRLSMKWKTAVDDVVGPLGLTHPQYVVLASLRGMGRYGDRPSQRQLADYTGLDPIYISKLTRALEASGLVHRFPDKHDLRAVQLIVTEEGELLVDRAIVLVRKLVEELTAPLGGTSSKAVKMLMENLELLLAVPQPAIQLASRKRRGKVA